jgi:hypothetical protein
VLVIDTEGNASQCADMPEIPEFLLLETKDPQEVIKALDDVAAGKLKFSDGALVETVSIDSYTVLWSVRQETGSMAAERRAAKYNKSPDEANMTQLDWVLAKRPLKMLNTRLNNCPIKHVVLIARENDLYQQKEGGRKDEMVRVGVKPDVVKGTEYEVNVIFHFGFDPGGVWTATVDKVQGKLGEKMPKGKTFKKFPIKELLEFAAGMTGAAGTEKGEIETAQDSARREKVEGEPSAQKPTKAEPSKPAKPQGGASTAEVEAKAKFLKEAAALGYKLEDGRPDVATIRNVLESKGLYPYGPEKHAEAMAALKAGLAKLDPAAGN